LRAAVGLALVVSALGAGCHGGASARPDGLSLATSEPAV